MYCCGSQRKLDQLRIGVELVHAFVLQVAGLCFRFNSSFWSSLFTTLVLHLLNLSPGFGCCFPSSLDISLPLVTCHTCPYPQSYLPTGARAFTQGNFCSHYLLACLLVALGGRMVDFGSGMLHPHSVWGLRWCNFRVPVWMFPPLSSSWKKRWLVGSMTEKG